MSKKKREAIGKAAVRVAQSPPSSALLKQTESTESSDPARGKWRSHWSKLSFQGKLLTVLVIGIFSLGTFGAGMKYLEENARQTIAQRNASTPLNPSQEGFLAKINPFVPPPPPSPTPQLSKEYIYAGSRLLAVEDVNANAAPPADLAVWRPSTGVWWVMGGQGSQQVTQAWGMVEDIPVPGDYDGDGKTDFSIFRPDDTAHTGTWYVFYSASSSWTAVQWGAHDDEVAPADFDGDGKTDMALWRPSTGVWYILKSSDGGYLTPQLGGSSYGDKIAPGDYDGDGKADIGVWRDSNKTFYSQNSSNLASQTATFSNNSSEPVSADYDGDGRADYAIRSGANWIILNSSTNQTQTISWQQSTDKAVHNDYDGDGKTDVAVWRDATGNWYIRKSSDSQLRQETWGMSSDIPVPAFYRR